LTQTIPAAGAVRAATSGSPSDDAAVEPDLEEDGAAVDEEEAGSERVFFDADEEDEEADPAPTPGAPATAGSTFCAFDTIRCGRAFSRDDDETPLRERSSSDL
jgi:hypothetical protein